MILGAGERLPVFDAASIREFIDRGVSNVAEALTKRGHTVRSVPVRRIVYPGGLEYLSDVRDTILADFEDHLEPVHLPPLASPL